MKERGEVLAEFLLPKVRQLRKMRKSRQEESKRESRLNNKSKDLLSLLHKRLKKKRDSLVMRFIQHILLLPPVLLLPLV